MSSKGAIFMKITDVLNLGVREMLVTNGRTKEGLDF